MSDEYVEVPMEQYGGGYAVPQMSPQFDRGDLIEKIKPEAIVEIMRQRLLGKEFSDGKWVDVPALQKRKLTEVGAWEISNLMLGISTISTSISKLEDKEINDRAFNIAKTAQRMLLANWKEYGIRNASQFFYVHQIIFSNTFVVLKQASDASIQDLLKGTVRGEINGGYMPKYKETTTRKIGRMLGLVGD